MLFSFAHSKRMTLTGIVYMLARTFSSRLVLTVSFSSQNVSLFLFSFSSFHYYWRSSCCCYCDCYWWSIFKFINNESFRLSDSICTRAITFRLAKLSFQLINRNRISKASWWKCPKEISLTSPSFSINGGKKERKTCCYVNNQGGRERHHAVVIDWRDQRHHHIKAK